ncbi:MFS transporter [Schleiferilactobacillus shenzhenensis]|uniref:Major facilitator superfamily (MFS) profile domain-containing protein n=1 Tax=Schleiferilactobacillus shenzhenensis LY-73 TaxID=1231336 RepID=U4TVK0_9LACO|nr:MFS transporter [Schleiferilactobacillus shenzhenensis]ERL65417.1 hypothetical protein L248_2816 [Schleiferilactobacillus shenzhenensis LY-73]
MEKENRNIVRLIARGQTNGFGNKIYDYANKLVIAGLGSQSSFFMGMYQASETIVSIIFDIFGGVIADTRDRKKVLVITDLAAAIATFVVFLQYSKSNPWLFVIVNVILAVLYSFNSPTYKAIVKDLLSKKNIYKYNSLSKTISELISVVTPLLGMLLITALGFKFGMLVNALSFFISAIIEWRFEVINTSPVKPGAHETTLHAMREGFKYIKSDKGLMTVLIASSLINFFFAGYEFSIPFTNQMAHFDNMFAYILIAESVGNIVGASLNGLLKLDWSMTQYSRCLLGVSLPIIAIPFLTFHWSMILILCGVSSGFMTVFNIQLFSDLQSNVKTEYLGRVFSVIFTVAILFMPVGTYVFSAINIKTWPVFGLVGIGELLVFIFMAGAIRIFKID